ncbi:hypothetical protein AURDEDRAFT_178670 [Auricularia subglabra TFB-10046 SS5]|uniref:Uncharacterized protein n=1 Tax=Auricularia subglabra (strain TFB-10046 / SS5) TaxID=717982 RepID=J0CPZ9_AURST|nr:hypothetical protein AURDEDRAFT_178670 [Auricularia subglabra TFB-10046 SS5]
MLGVQETVLDVMANTFQATITRHSVEDSLATVGTRRASSLPFRSTVIRALHGNTSQHYAIPPPDSIAAQPMAPRALSDDGDLPPLVDSQRSRRGGTGGLIGGFFRDAEHPPPPLPSDFGSRDRRLASSLAITPRRCKPDWYVEAYRCSKAGAAIAVATGGTGCLNLALAFWARAGGSG